ncbi:transferase family-domain-containing protein [Lenzites betulinus]|nr:transferase family-domain-containing protein [Lenzites betulinus]
MANLTGDPLLELISRDRILPEEHVSGDVHTVSLSILDNTVIRFAMTNAAWYYDNTTNNAGVLHPGELVRSLRRTLNAYPQWAGQLQWTSPGSGRGLARRRGRVCIVYGSAEDQGIELILARSPATLAALVPDNETRLGMNAWCADQFPSAQLLCPTDLALTTPTGYMGKPSACAQITTFACGGVGIALRIAHCLADATTLIQFARHWSMVHSAMVHSQPPPPIAPVFDPALIDSAATGDVDSDTPDPEVIRVSQSLPIIKHDWNSLSPTGSLAISSTTGDVSSEPVAHFMVYLSPEEVQRIWEDASAQVPSGSRISRFDALLAFIWRLIIRARSAKTILGSDPVHMIVTIGVRSRLSPPLPDQFIGSPITLARITLPADAVAASTSTGAVAIRSAVARFTPETVGAFLHDVAHHADPQKYWSAFFRRRLGAYTCWRSLDVYALDYGSGARPPYIDALMPAMDGQRHSVVTSWQDLHVYDIDFGVGAPPRYVDAFIPDMDGCIHIMDAGPSVKGASPASAAGSAGRWYDETYRTPKEMNPVVRREDYEAELEIDVSERRDACQN